LSPKVPKVRQAGIELSNPDASVQAVSKFNSYSLCIGNQNCLFQSIVYLIEI
jgi:hypothetical protein